MSHVPCWTDFSSESPCILLACQLKGLQQSKLVAQLVCASTSGLCCAEHHKFEPQSSHVFWSVPFTSYNFTNPNFCMSVSPLHKPLAHAFLIKYIQNTFDKTPMNWLCWRNFIAYSFSHNVLKLVWDLLRTIYLKYNWKQPTYSVTIVKHNRNASTLLLIDADISK